MANRLSIIATRTGDDGTTGLGDGTRIDKDDIRVQAMGNVDELNSMIGVLLIEPLPDGVRNDLIAIQHDLFDLGGELCIPGFDNLAIEQLERLDECLARYNADLPRLAEFILPGGSRGGALAHVCRTICRRAERSVVTLSRNADLRPACRQYLNRLSDLLFVIARVVNHHDQVGDVLWEQGRNKQK